MDNKTASQILTKEFMTRRRNEHGERSFPINALKCYDGFTVSVQASAFNYCWPRENNADMWVRWELGYPSAEVAELLPYAEDETRPMDTVYAQVPSEVVMSVLEAHGGLIMHDPVQELILKSLEDQVDEI